MFIRKLFEKIPKRIFIFFAVFGPATITAMSDNDAAGVATYSLAGANFGYSILFILFAVTILLAITQEMGVRVAITTGKGLGDLIREKYGIKISIWVFLFLFIANMGTIVANFSALKTTSSMFGVPVLPFIFVITLFSVIFISKGSYETNQRIFLISALFYIAYVFSAFEAKPDWGLAFRSLVVPTGIGFSKEFLLGAIAVLGTTITPWGQFFIHSYIIDKKITPDKLKYSQIETYFGAFLTNFFSFFMIIATAATLFIHKIPLTSGAQAAIAIEPFAGQLAGTLFGLGILNAGFMGIVIVSLSTAYAFAEFFGAARSLDVPFYKGKLFYGIFIFQMILAAIIVMLPFIDLFKIVFYTQALNGVLLPVVFYFLLRITNDKELMGTHTNGRWYNFIVVAGSLIIIVASILTIITSF